MSNCTNQKPPNDFNSISELKGSCMIVDSSDHDPGEKARLQLPTMKENDTHCIDFSYLLYSKSGANPGTLNILVRVNKGPLANPIWNVTGSTGRDWLRAELAVSTFWPNEYQVIFEAEVSDGRNGYIAIDDIQVLSYPCDKSPHFLRLGDVEVNAGQNATFQCIATGRDAVNNKLWLQRRNGEDIPVAQTKNINHRRFAATFKLQEDSLLSVEVGFTADNFLVILDHRPSDTQEGERYKSAWSQRTYIETVELMKYIRPKTTGEEIRWANKGYKNKAA
ncbi:homeobox protein SEBOX [Platysternon megacephalum]|uniref:Homeobox protein SEBOX n=1 Tax=Platysternon megacephalum TaxID=55544 RepID=A0A4D9E3Q4_9SAUR|nr:homeobox protein SEBOX [Platysternon megacephalum]